MLAGTDKVKVFTLYLVHHGIHLGKAHNAGNDIRADHERRHTVCKASVDHKIPCIAYHSRVQSGNISHEIIETVSCNTSCAVKIYAFQFFHYIGVVRYLKIRYHRLTETLNLHIL